MASEGFPPWSLENFTFSPLFSINTFHYSQKRFVKVPLNSRDIRSSLKLIPKHPLFH